MAGRCGVDEDRLGIELACRRLVDEYVHALDLGPITRAAELFTDDGVFEEPTGAIRGREELDRHFGPDGPAAAVPTRHLVTNLVVTVEDPDHATARSYLTYFHALGDRDPALPVPVGAPSVLGVYHDRFVRTDAGWRFAHKRVEITHLAPALLDQYREHLGA